MKTNVVPFGPVNIGGSKFAVIAGPCSIESEDQLLSTAKFVKESGASILRGGVYKLRTSPKSFQGLGKSAFDLVRLVKQETNMPFISEVTDPRQISDLYDLVEVFQVGSRNMHNYELLKELGKTDKPILLKRGLAGLVKEWLLAADYITEQGNEKVVLCERGIRTFETVTRNTFDINAIAHVKQFTNFPVIADPSHGTGVKELIAPISMAAVAAGCDGLILEVHPNPSEAKSDGHQALKFDEFEKIMTDLKKLLPVFDKTI